MYHRNLKSLTDKHREIIRRLVTGEADVEICRSLGMSASHLSFLKNKDPLFINELYALRAKVDEMYMQSRSNALEIIQATAVEAAEMAREVVVHGTMGSNGKTDEDGNPVEANPVSNTLRNQNIWDVLKTAGVSAQDSKDAVLDLADRIVEAYEKRYKKNVRPEDAVVVEEAIDVTPVVLNEARDIKDLVLVDEESDN